MNYLLAALLLFSLPVFSMSGGYSLTSNSPASQSVLGIYIYDKTTKKGGLCTGTIVGHQTVITAAHCFEYINSKSVDIVLAFGNQPYLVLDQSTTERNPEHFRRTTHFLVNPKYKPKSPLLEKLASDVALVFLNPNESFPRGYTSLPVVHAYTLNEQPAKAIVNGVGRDRSDDTAIDSSRLIFKTDVFSLVRDVNQLLHELKIDNPKLVSDNALSSFGSPVAPFFLVRSETAALQKGDSGSALIQNYFGTYRVFGIHKGGFIVGGRDMGSAFTNLHQPQLNRWVHNNIR
ncbi:MAG: trypsin-like serine protease [Bdellovibrionales bacterium]